MPIFENIQGHPYCIPNDYQNGNGVNMALWNEISDSVKFELNSGNICINNFQNYRYLLDQIIHPIAVGGSGAYSTYSIPINFITIRGQEFGFELMPFYEQLKFIAHIHLPQIKQSQYINWNNYVYIKKLLSIRISVFNVTRNTSAIIGHFFTDENEVNAWCAAGGFPQHGTPAQYVQTIGQNQIFLNYAVDIPDIIKPLGNWTDIGRLKVELLLPPSNPTFLFQIGYNTLHPDFYGIKSFILKQIMQCQ